MNVTGIEWTSTVLPDGTVEPGFTSNPLKYRDADGKVVWACAKTSPGCAHCYSETLAKRYGRGGPFNLPTVEALTPFMDEKELKTLLRSPKLAGRRVFTFDMTDCFGAWVPDGLLDRFFAVVVLRPDVTFQVLTKRATRMREYWTDPHRAQAIHEAIKHRMGYDHPDRPALNTCDLPLKNLWLGTSVESQAAADERHPLLMRTPAAVHFWSAEPLIGGIDCGPLWAKHGKPGWVIVGGESGAGSRPFHLDWARSIQDQCDTADVPLFFKQAGSNPHDWTRGDPPNHEPPEVVPLRLRDRKGGDLNELPAALRVRDYPGAI